MSASVVTLSVPAAASVKGFDEDSVASLSTTQDETQVAENGVTNNSSHPFQGGGYMLAASYWPKVNHCRCVQIQSLFVRNNNTIIIIKPNKSGQQLEYEILIYNMSLSLMITFNDVSRENKSI